MRVPKSLRPAAQFAEAHGFKIEMTAKNHLRYKKPGHRTVYSGGTVSDHRAVRNIIAELTKSLEHRR